MTVRKTPSELRKAQIVKATRTAIRLKHALAADRELNDVLPDVESAFDAAIQRGELPDKIDVEALAREVVQKQTARAE
jgi:hypothetical protein